MRKLNILIASVLLGATYSNLSHARFFVDDQGLGLKKELELKKRLLEEQKEEDVYTVPDNYNVFVDKSIPNVYKIGKQENHILSSFSDGITLYDGLRLLMPQGWTSYVDDVALRQKNITYSIKDADWTSALKTVSEGYGLKFVVNYTHNVLEIKRDSDFTEPDFTKPIALKDPESERVIFVYTAEKRPNGGAIISNGKIIPIGSKDQE